MEPLNVPIRADQEATLTVELIEGSGDIAGAAIGAAVGLIGGPAGVVGGAGLGAALARVFKHVGADIRRRVLGPREEVRIGGAAAFAAAAIAEGLDAGQQPRQDGFFEAHDGDRPAGEEILEGVLQKARDAYEERKVRLLGLLYANIAFHPEISPQNANHLIALAGELTYRQLVALAIARQQQAQNGHLLRNAPFRGDDTAIGALGLDGNALVTEIYGLYQRGLISDATGAAWISLADVNPGSMRPMGSGEVLVEMMRLMTIPIDEWREFMDRFPTVQATTTV